MEEVFGTTEKIDFERVWEFIGERTSGKKLTVARWIRNYISRHPEYKQDSNITNSIAYDLIDTIT